MSDHKKKQESDETADQPASPPMSGEMPPLDGDMFDAVALLESNLAQAENKVAEYYDAFLRAKAEADNTRRRAQEDVTKASKFAVEKFAIALLPVKDSLESALATEGQTLDKLREGVELTLKQLLSAFDTSGLKEENPIGQKLDPNKHHAISAIESDEEANTVIEVLQKGYLLNERVIRPAMVIVAKAQDEQEGQGGQS